MEKNPCEFEYSVDLPSSFKLPQGGGLYPAPMFAQQLDTSTQILLKTRASKLRSAKVEALQLRMIGCCWGNGHTRCHVSSKKGGSKSARWADGF